MDSHFQRSTKGASKQRRDQIKEEVNELRDLVPVSGAIKPRLSQLQTMAICNAYIAKTNCFRNAVAFHDDDVGGSYGIQIDFTEALPGFLLTITTDGKLLHISENVTEYLGHSMVEVMTQADSVYDVIDGEGDQRSLREFLLASRTKLCEAAGDGSRDELNFVCHMSLGKSARRNNSIERLKVMRVCGRMVWPGGRMALAEPIFVACCSPMLTCSPVEQTTALQTLMFQTSHSLDMKFIDIDQNGEYHLGCSRSELHQQSWYQMIHRDDTAEAVQRHKELIQEGSEAARSLCVRIQTKYGSFICLHIVMRLSGSPFNPLCADNFAQEINCLNHVISEREAFELKQRQRWEEIHLNRANSFEPRHDLRKELSLSKAFVEERFPEYAASEFQSSRHSCMKTAEGIGQELLTEPRCKLQQKHAKKARTSEPCFKPVEMLETAAFESAHFLNESSNAPYFDNVLQQESVERSSVQMNHNVKHSLDFLTGQMAKTSCIIQNPLAPPSSDNDHDDDCVIVHVNVPASKFKYTSCTPPYSPPSRFSYFDEAVSTSYSDESSFFHCMASAMNPRLMQSKHQPKLHQKFQNDICQSQRIPDNLPILDQCTIESFFSGVERHDNALSSRSTSCAESISSQFQRTTDRVPMFPPRCVEQLQEATERSRLVVGPGFIDSSLCEATDLNSTIRDSTFLEMLSESWLETIDMFSTAEQLNVF